MLVCGVRAAPRLAAVLGNCVVTSFHLSAGTNGSFGRLDSNDADLLGPHMETVELQQGLMLERAGRPVHQVYFLKRGLASVIAFEDGKQALEVAILGRDDMTGTSVMLGTPCAMHDIVMQTPGTGYRVSAAKLKQLLRSHAGLGESLLSNVNHLMRQISATALANGRATLEVRLARRLLVCLDRIDGDRISVTHETLARMLGVRRPGVTVALHVMEGKKLIRSTRGLCTVLDRAGLEALAEGFYVPDPDPGYSWSD